MEKSFKYDHLIHLVAYSTDFTVSPSSVDALESRIRNLLLSINTVTHSKSTAYIVTKQAHTRKSVFMK